MKKILVAIMLVLLSSLSSHAFSYDDWNKGVEASGCDWVLHSAVGATVSQLTEYYFYKEAPLYQKLILNVAVGLAAGSLIELFDKNYDWGDVVEYGYGGAGGVILMYSWRF